MGWAVVDHYLRPKAAYYAMKRSCAPVKVIVRARPTTRHARCE
jgi:hypothetical protein